MPMIFITGAGNVGKSSTTRILKQQLATDRYDIHDIDEADLWGDDYEGWKAKKVEYWLQQSIKNDEEGKSTILCGIIYPRDVRQAASYAKAHILVYFLLDADPDEIRKRWAKHYGDRFKEAPVQSKMNRHLEIAKELRDAYTGVKPAHVIDTTREGAEEVAEQIIKALTDFEKTQP